MQNKCNECEEHLLVCVKLLFMEQMNWNHSELDLWFVDLNTKKILNSWHRMSAFGQPFVKMYNQQRRNSQWKRKSVSGFRPRQNFLFYELCPLCWLYTSSFAGESITANDEYRSRHIFEDPVTHRGTSTNPKCDEPCPDLGPARFSHTFCALFCNNMANETDKIATLAPLEYAGVMWTVEPDGSLPTYINLLWPFSTFSSAPRGSSIDWRFTEILFFMRVTSLHVAENHTGWEVAISTRSLRWGRKIVGEM